MKPVILVGKGKLGTIQQYALIRGGKHDVHQPTSIDQDKKEPVVDQAMQFLEAFDHASGTHAHV